MATTKPGPTKMTLQLNPIVISCFALGVSALSLIVSTIVAFKHRGKLQLSVLPAEVVGAWYVQSRPCLNISVTNIGKEQISVIAVGGTLKNSNQFVALLDNLPKLLSPTERYTGQVFELDIVGHIVTFFAQDSLGRKHYLGKDELQKINAWDVPEVKPLDPIPIA